jgi:hypothetical protein
MAAGAHKTLVDVRFTHAQRSHALRHLALLLGTDWISTHALIILGATFHIATPLAAARMTRELRPALVKVENRTPFIASKRVRPCPAGSSGGNMDFADVRAHWDVILNQPPQPPYASARRGHRGARKTRQRRGVLQSSGAVAQVESCQRESE